MTRRLHEEPMRPQTAQAFLDDLPRMRAALLNSRRILGPVAYARHLHELDTEERDARAILRRAQLRHRRNRPRRISRRPLSSR
jgi:hypothetical protein